jgi:hypothetical protein
VLNALKYIFVDNDAFHRAYDAGHRFAAFQRVSLFSRQI